jgi:hypothetical protein
MTWFFDFISSRAAVQWLTAIDALGALTFFVLYAFGSRGWWRTATGRNFAAMFATLAILLVLVVAARWFGPLPGWVWTGGMATLGITIWWCVGILLRKQHEDRKPHEDQV